MRGNVAVSELDRLVNACLLPGFAGANPPEWVVEGLANGLSGATIYGANLTDGEAIPRIAAAIRRSAPDALVAIDEEGGDVTRLDYLTGSTYPGNLALGVVDDVALTRAVAEGIANDLVAAGVNFNLAPSVDVNSDPRNPVIGVRSFGSEPDLVSRHGVAYIEGMQTAGVAASAKHFPGHGATTADSHHDLPLVDCDEATFRTRELPPFLAAIEAGVQSIMTAHVIVNALDPALPATLSHAVLTDLVRRELGYDGVIITDALDMAAVRREHGIAGAAIKALTAGADLLLLGSVDGESYCREIREGVAAAVKSGDLDPARVEEAAERVGRMRAWARPGATVPPTDRGIGLDAARRAVHSSGAATVNAPATVVELRAAANLAVGEAHWSLAEPLRSLGMLADSLTVTEGGISPQDAVAAAAGSPLVIAVRDAYRQPWQRGWIEAALTSRPDAVVVAIGMPQDAELAPGAHVLAYGAGRVNTRAAAEVLAGRQE